MKTKAAPRSMIEARLLLTFLFRAGDRTRTGDVQLGKLAFYQLNYARGCCPQTT